MALYTKQFTKPYPEGYVDKPQKTTPVTAETLNMQDRCFVALEEFLMSEEVNFKLALTVGTRKAGMVGYNSLVLGSGTASGTGAIALYEGNASGTASFAGNNGTASGNYSFAWKGATASGYGAISLGENCQSTGKYSFSQGKYSIASGEASFAEGSSSKAQGIGSHAEGGSCTAVGNSSHAEGGVTIAKGGGAHAEGSYTIASGDHQHVQGKYNIEDTENKYAHIVGNGSAKFIDNVFTELRSNAHTLDWQGNAWYAGDVTNGNGVSLDGLMALIGTTGQLRTIVETFPEEDISTNTIYMVLKEYGGESDIYNEYINVDGTPEGWEFIGNSAVDLSDYYTKSQVDQLLSEYVQVETGKGLSSNDYTDEEKQLVESIINMTVENALAILNEEAA